MSHVETFTNELSGVQTLAPRKVKNKKIVQALYTRQIVTVVGIKTTAGRFLPVSHEGYSNETYVDKVDLLGKSRAEFIGRKLKGIERRAHMSLFREMIEATRKSEQQGELFGAQSEAENWKVLFGDYFDSECFLPDKLCLACWNCSLFGGLDPGKGATFSRIRYFDTFSIEEVTECVQTDDSPEQMAIGNMVGEDLSQERGEASFHRYEYVKAGTRFPFITIIECPTLLDVVGYITAVRLADQHGYGKYSANNGKFKTQFLAISTGYPMFSVLDMLEWPWSENNDLSAVVGNMRFEGAVNEPVTLLSDDITDLQKQLRDAFTGYVEALEAEA